MAIAAAIAAAAMSFLAIDAGIDVRSSDIAKRIEMAQASIVNVAMSQHELASAVQAWVRRDHQKPAEQSAAID